MAAIKLTDADLMDIGMGHTINALAEDGSEHELGGGDFTVAALATIEHGGKVAVEIEGVTCEISKEVA